jgi:hypothetical protein
MKREEKEITTGVIHLHRGQTLTIQFYMKEDLLCDDANNRKKNK